MARDTDGSDTLGLGQRLAADAARTYVRWDEKLWQAYLEGPAAALAERLDGDSGDHAAKQALFESVLELAKEAVGLGYLYPAEVIGRRSFFHLAFHDLIPRLLPDLQPQDRPSALAALWNLSENLEARESWLQHIFVAAAQGLGRLDGLESLIARVSAQVFEPPKTSLELDNMRVHWEHLGSFDAHFLPGAVRFLAPSVACVYHRETGPDGKPRSALGLLLGPKPEILGAMPADEVPSAPEDRGELLWTKVAEEDFHFTDACDYVRNPYRGVATLETSQFVVILLPGDGS